MNKLTIRLKAQARGHLTGRYTALMLAFILANIIMNLPSLFLNYTLVPGTIASSVIEIAVSFLIMLISYIFVVGENHICLLYARDKALVPPSEMWYGFKYHADSAIHIAFLIFLRFLTTAIPFLLFVYYWLYQNPGYPALALVIVSGLLTAVLWIRISLKYSLVYFLLLDFPSKTPKEIMEQSVNMTKSHMWQLFYLTCSFIGLYILGFLSMGLAMLWIRPYVRMTMTEFYLSLLPGKNVVDVTV